MRLRRCGEFEEEEWRLEINFGESREGNGGGWGYCEKLSLVNIELSVT